LYWKKDFQPTKKHRWARPFLRFLARLQYTPSDASSRKFDRSNSQEKTMATDRKAGQLILSQLKMLNESIFLLEETIEPAILEGIDASVESFAEKHDWVGEYTLATDDDCWLAPKTWISNPEDEDPEYKAWFAIDCIDGDKDYWVSLFCEAAAQGGRAGFRFTINSDILGGKNAWNAYAKKIPQELISKLTELGFQNLGKGNFFLPVKLDSEALGNSFLEYGKFSNDDDSFAPLLDAMEKLKKAAPIFDQIISNYPAASPTK